MGCDIHLYFEKKNKEGTWEKIEIDDRLLPDDRDYELFAFLADVRNGKQLESPFANRGLPTDRSISGDDHDETLWLGDHSFTYAYLDEILKAPWEKSGLQYCYFHLFCLSILPRLMNRCGFFLREEMRNIRVIMGFDS